MSDLASFVANWTGGPVVDRTEVKGLYKVETKGWLPMQPMSQATAPEAEDGSDVADVPTLFQVLEKLGLRMNVRNGKTDVYGVDHIENPPKTDQRRKFPSRGAARF